MIHRDPGWLADILLGSAKGTLSAGESEGEGGGRQHRVASSARRPKGTQAVAARAHCPRAKSPGLSAMTLLIVDLQFLSGSSFLGPLKELCGVTASSFGLSSRRPPLLKTKRCRQEAPKWAAS